MCVSFKRDCCIISAVNVLTFIQNAASTSCRFTSTACTFTLRRTSASWDLAYHVKNCFFKSEFFVQKTSHSLSTDFYFLASG